MIKDFTFNEFNISGRDLPPVIADKILRYHMIPLQESRNRIGEKIVISQRSGYRPVWWEKSKGRSGNSQHTFKEKGAVDVTSPELDLLLCDLKENSPYTRIVYYPIAKFIHCDYAATSGKREYYTSDNLSNWTFQKYLD